MMSKFLSLNNAVTEMAQYVEDSNYEVKASYGEETVEIVDLNTGKVEFRLTGPDAMGYIEESEDLARDGKVDFDTAMMANAKAYIKTLED